MSDGADECQNCFNAALPDYYLCEACAAELDEGCCDDCDEGREALARYMAGEVKRADAIASAAMTQRRNDQGEVVGGCAIHRWSMGVCIHCGEAPLGSMPRNRLGQPCLPRLPYRGDWEHYWQSVDYAEWEDLPHPVVRCSKCNTVHRWEDCKNSECGLCGPGSTLKCLKPKEGQ